MLVAGHQLLAVVGGKEEPTRDLVRISLDAAKMLEQLLGKLDRPPEEFVCLVVCGKFTESIEQAGDIVEESGKRGWLSLVECPSRPWVSRTRPQMSRAAASAACR